MSGSELAEKLHARRSGRGWMARCPAHEDRSASLSIGEGRDGRALFHCFAGCTTASVLAALGLRWTDILPPREKMSPSELHRQRHARARAEMAVWRIHDAVVRLHGVAMNNLHAIEREQAQVIAELSAARTDADRERCLDRLAELAPQSTACLARFNFVFSANAETLSRYVMASPDERRRFILEEVFDAKIST
jgi:hypothetical protein